MARYPGSVLIKVLLNRYHHWRRKLSKPKAQPGRLDAAKAWLLQWEGLLVGGVAIGGISAIAVRVYSEERMDDLDRRHDRRQFFEGSCMMVGAHLAAVQHSLNFWTGIRHQAAHRCQQRQQWQQQQQQRTQYAACQLQAWQQRCKAAGCCCPQPATGEAPMAQPLDPSQAVAGPWRVQGTHDPKQQEQQHHEQQQQVLADTTNPAPYDKTNKDQKPSSTNNEHNLAADGTAESSGGSSRTGDNCERQAEDASFISNRHQEGIQQDLTMQQCHQQQQSLEDGGNPRLKCQWYNIPCWVVQQRQQAAARVLCQEQQRLVLGEVGLDLWQQLFELSALKVDSLQQQQAAQQLLLLSHCQQLAAWQQLDHRVQPMPGFAFYLPRFFSQPSQVFNKGVAKVWLWLTVPSPTNSSSSGCQQDHELQQQQVPCLPAATNSAATCNSSSSSSSSSSGGSNKLWRWLAKTFERRKQQQQEQLSPGAQAAGPPSVLSAELPVACHQEFDNVWRWHVRVRLWWPQWIPEELDEQDYQLVSQEYLERTAAAAAAAAVDWSDSQERSDVDSTAAGCWIGDEF